MRKFGREQKIFQKSVGLTVLLLCLSLYRITYAADSQPTDPREGTTATPVFLSQGDRGAAVEALQADLSALGYDPGTQRGVYTLATARAVKAFEEDCGLYCDGVCTAAVARAVQCLARVQPSAKVPSATQLWQALGAYGISEETVGSLRDALILFQRTNGLLGTGNADLATCAALGFSVPGEVVFGDPAATEEAYRDLCVSLLSEALCCYAHTDSETVDLYAMTVYARTLSEAAEGDAYASLSEVCLGEMCGENHADTVRRFPWIRTAAEVVIG